MGPRAPRAAGPRPGKGAGRRARSPRAMRPWIAGVVATAIGGIVAFGLIGRGGGVGSAKEPFVGGDLHSLVVHPTRPATLYVGGHEGVAVSADGGATWEPLPTLRGADAMGWAFLGGRILVGGHPGLWVSDDGGRKFELRNAGLPATDIHALGAGGGVLYAASPQIGVFASTDGGRTWEVRTDRVGQGFMGRILVDPDDPEHVVAPDMGAGAVESTDGGRTWRRSPRRRRRESLARMSAGHWASRHGRYSRASSGTTGPFPSTRSPTAIGWPLPKPERRATRGYI